MAVGEASRCLKWGDRNAWSKSVLPLSPREKTLVASLASPHHLHLAGPERGEALGPDRAGIERRRQVLERLVDGFVGEPERSPMVPQRLGRTAQGQGFDRLGGVHVVVAHEPARLV